MDNISIAAINAATLWQMALSTDNLELHNIYFEEQNLIYNQIACLIGEENAEQLINQCIDHYPFLMRHNSILN
jgi:hypothetical protein